MSAILFSMARKSSNGQNIISEIKRVEKSLKSELKKSLGLEFRKELKKTERNLRVEVLRVEKRVENLEDGQKEIKEGQKRLETKVDNLERTLDGFVGKVDNLVKEDVVGADQYRRHEVRLNEQEAGITKIEITAAS